MAYRSEWTTDRRAGAAEELGLWDTVELAAFGTGLLGTGVIGAVVGWRLVALLIGGG